MRPNTIIEITNLLEKDGYVVGEVTTSEEVSYHEGTATHIDITCWSAMQHMYNRGYRPDGKPYYSGFRGAYNTRVPAIKNVVFNDPATIVIWADGTKTVVKTQNGEEFDPEKGLAMSITKKAFGNQGNYYETIKKWVEKYDPPVTEGNPLIKHADEIQKSFRDIILNAGKEGSE